MCVGNILAGIAGRWVDRPIRPDVGDRGALFPATQFLETGRLRRIELPGIRGTGVGFSATWFQVEITGIE
jgi:hypothetical protein